MSELRWSKLENGMGYSFPINNAIIAYKRFVVIWFSRKNFFLANFSTYFVKTKKLKKLIVSNFVEKTLLS